MISVKLSLLQPLLTLAGIRVVQAATTQAAEIASLYGLTTSTSFPFPTATLPPADTATFLSANHGTDPWAIVKKNKENQVDLSFVVDPFDTADTANAVLQVREYYFSRRNDSNIHLFTRFSTLLIRSVARQEVPSSSIYSQTRTTPT